ncbi:MAG: DUF4116 domain-containing protein, partial [Crocinitomicaceae bacterium]
MKNFSLILISTLFVNLLCAQKSITREEAIAMVKKDFYAFESLDQKYQSDKEIFSLAMKMCNDAMKFASQDLKKNKGFVTRALKVDERTLKYADESLKKDKDIVFFAVTNDPSTLSYAAKSLQNDKNFILEILDDKYNCRL